MEPLSTSRIRVLRVTHRTLLALRDFGDSARRSPHEHQESEFLLFKVSVMFELYTDYSVRSSLFLVLNLVVKLGVGRQGRLCLFPSMLRSDLRGRQLRRSMNE